MNVLCFQHDDFGMIDWFRAMSLPAQHRETIMAGIRWNYESPVEATGPETKEAR